MSSLLNAARTVASALAAWGDLVPTELTFAANQCWALRSGQTHPLNKNEAQPPCLHLSEPLPAFSYCLPLQVQGEIIGVLNVQAREEDVLNDAKRQLAYNIVEQAGMALSNLKLRDALREQSIRDPLTGLYNRRYMEEALHQQLSRVTRRYRTGSSGMVGHAHYAGASDPEPRLHGAQLR